MIRIVYHVCGKKQINKSVSGEKCVRKEAPGKETRSERFFATLPLMHDEMNPLAIPWQKVQNPLLRVLLRCTRRLLERLLGLESLMQLYRHIGSTPSPERFTRRVLNLLQISPDCTAADRSRIPAGGALVVVANHPFGAVEGMLLLEEVRSRRTDVRIMANYLLSSLPELRDDLIFVDPFGREGSVARNIHALRQALQWLRDGKALIVFPAGEVASFAPKAFRVREAPWQVSVMRLIRNADLPVRILPVCIQGSASLLFHLVGKIHPRLRTLLLAREMIRLRGRKILLRMGSPLDSSKLFKRFRSDYDALRYLRFRTLLLEGRTRTTAFDEQMQRLTLDLEDPASEPVIPPVDPRILERELADLPPEAFLFAAGDVVVYAAQGRDIPHTLREIGRLRELTFRAAGEGTGRTLDTDEFDEAYYQILLWNRQRREIIGCYRLACSDLLAESDGFGALYTRTLFRFDERFLGHLPGPAIEVGRSFVRPDFQRTFAPLLLLWRGVLTFIADHPQYTVLFGAVSISQAFCPAAQDFLIGFLRKRYFDPALARWVSARLPPKRLRFSEWTQQEYTDFLQADSDVNDVLFELEEGRREVPVLIRQYLKLGGKLVAFNVDPDFGSVVDGLIVLNLLDAPARDIARYMGAEKYASYCAWHRPRQ